VREGFARLLGDSADHIALGQNTHELVTRWLSALPLAARRRVVTTDGEFHSIRRQLNRLAEEGLEVVKVPARPADALSDRMVAALDERTACVLVSSVLFETAEIVPGLDRVAAACARQGARLLVDAYHQLNVVPFDVSAMGLSDAFITGGGYKYCQLGEGNCFLRVPPECRLRPVVTGWFAEFESLESVGGDRVSYGEGAAAFAGATYDPTSHYRAAAVFDFHRAMGLTAEALHARNRSQVRRLISAFERLDVPRGVAYVEPLPEERRGGFLALRIRDAQTTAHALRARGVFVDARGDTLRLGPAPYLRDDQLDDAIAGIAELLPPA
jgi:kynureninase